MWYFPVMNQYTGSDFDDFLKEDGIYDEVMARVHKRMLAAQLQDAIAAFNLSKSQPAEQLQNFAPSTPTN